MTRRAPTVVSLFSGAGGLDLGLEAAGFSNRLCIEVDKDARATLRRNRPSWKLATPGDIHLHQPRDLLDLAGIAPRELDLLAGGPPCQPFSKSSYWLRGDTLRLGDPRSATLGAYLEVVDAFLPRVILLENVRGLTYARKNEGLRLLQDGFAAINRRRKTAYSVGVLNLNAASYGVPQLRERVFVVASRDGQALVAPPASHGVGLDLRPYTTAWDAIGDLDTDTWAEDLKPSGKWARLLPSVPEGQNYLWHTPEGDGEPLFGWRTRFWSFLLKLAKNRPSWTIQAEPGPATGPFHWKSRLLSIRELCRLQTFPDEHVIVGERFSAHRQVGNAVPCALAEIIGLEIRRQLLGHTRLRREIELRMPPSQPCPPAERHGRVPSEFHPRRKKYRPHPGTGLGPAARKRVPPRKPSRKAA